AAAIDDIDRAARLAAELVEVLRERGEIRLCGKAAVGFDVERHGLAEMHRVAIEPGTHLDRHGRNRRTQRNERDREQPCDSPWHASPYRYRMGVPLHSPSSPLRWRCWYSSRNLRRNKPPGSSGTRSSHCSSACCCSLRAVSARLGARAL